jgi:hypothetical protein
LHRCWCDMLWWNYVSVHADLRRLHHLRGHADVLPDANLCGQPRNVLRYGYLRGEWLHVQRLQHLSGYLDLSGLGNLSGRRDLQCGVAHMRRFAHLPGGDVRCDLSGQSDLSRIHHVRRLDFLSGFDDLPGHGNMSGLSDLSRGEHLSGGGELRIRNLCTGADLRSGSVLLGCSDVCRHANLSG